MPEDEVREEPRIIRLARAALEAPGPAGLPVVTMSWAQAQDGSIAAADGARVSLSGSEALILTHRLRSLHDAILVGIGTVLSDDPLLNVRLAPGPSPRPVILDSGLRMPLSAHLLARTDLSPWIFHERSASADRARALEARGARLFALDRDAVGLPLSEVLAALRANGIASVMVEGGARVLASFLSTGLARQAVITVSPMRLGGIRVPGTGPSACLPELRDREIQTFGRDTVIWGRLAPAQAP